MKINQIIHEAGTGLEIDRSIPGRTIARISGDLAHRTGSLTDKRLPDHHPDDDYVPWSGKVGASTRDDEEDTFDIDYTGDDGELNEFVTPQAVAQDPGLEREKDVDVIFFGFMPQDFTARTAWKALEDVLPREYPAGSERAQNKIAEVSKNNGAVVTTKPLSIAQKLVKEFQARGIKCRIDDSGLEEDITRRGFLKGAGAAAMAAAGGSALGQSIQMPTVDQVDRQKMTIVVDGQEYPLVILSPTDFRPRGGQQLHITCAQMGERCMGRYDAVLAQNRVFVLPGTKPPVIPAGVDESRRGSMPEPENFDSDWDYEDAMTRWRNSDSDQDIDYENIIDDEPDDWFDESREKVGNMDADAFDAALSRMKKLAGAGPLKTVYDPNKRVYRNVPHAVQPAQQPKKAR